MNTLPLTLNAIGGYPDCPLAEEGEEAKRGKVGEHVCTKYYYVYQITEHSVALEIQERPFSLPRSSLC